MKYDMVIRGGDVIDPGNGLRGKMDVAIRRRQDRRSRPVAAEVFCPGPEH